MKEDLALIIAGEGGKTWVDRVKMCKDVIGMDFIVHWVGVLFFFLPHCGQYGRQVQKSSFRAVTGISWMSVPELVVNGGDRVIV